MASAGAFLWCTLRCFHQPRRWSRRRWNVIRELWEHQWYLCPLFLALWWREGGWNRKQQRNTNSLQWKTKWYTNVRLFENLFFFGLYCKQASTYWSTNSPSSQVSVRLEDAQRFEVAGEDLFTRCLKIPILLPSFSCNPSWRQLVLLLLFSFSSHPFLFHTFHSFFPPQRFCFWIDSTALRQINTLGSKRHHFLGVAEN